MHSYDYRCKDCQQRFSLHYKTYADYDAAAPVCPECNSQNLSRIISKVALNYNTTRPRDYRDMSGPELNGIIHSSQPQQTGEVFRQMIDHEKDITPEFAEVTDRLLKGEKMSSIERDVHVPDKVPSTPGLPREMLEQRIRIYEHHKDDPYHREKKTLAVAEAEAKKKAAAKKPHAPA